eukprot:Skav203408  [mRNA]  locus=scaffold1743:211691:219580:- [translate_table: standard]
MSSIHLQTLNPSIAALHDLPALFVTESMPLSSKALRVLSRLGGGLSSFGFGGTNAHGVVSCATEAGEPPVKQRGEEILVLELVNECLTTKLVKQVGFRFLRAKPGEGIFEVAMRMDVYDVVKHHVVFGSIVVPGVVFVEMALEATRELFGHGVRITDVWLEAMQDGNMMFPFVVPERITGAEPPPIMRFVLKIESTSATGTVTVHAEGGINRSPLRGEEAETDNFAKANPVNVDELRARIDEDVYAAIDGVGLYLGPMFQTAKQLWRKEPEEGSESKAPGILMQ